MGLFSRIYFNAVFGALGGLLGWMLFGVFDEKAITVTPPAAASGAGAVTPSREEAEKEAQAATDRAVRWRLVLGGALIGAAIGYFVVSVEAFRDRSLVRFVRLATYGMVLGCAGGALGMFVGNEVNYAIVGLLGASSTERGAVLGTLHLLGTMLARGLGWMFLGLAIGASEGIAARSLGKFSYGTIGGALGGFLGGALFGLIYPLTMSQSGQPAIWGALGLMLLGACIGSLSAFVQGVFQPASVKVLRGWQEGREYPLDKQASLLGRDEHADIALFRDMRVEKKHAYIRREGPRYILVNNQAPPDFTRVNDEPVGGQRELRDGDRLQLGNVVLRFQMRAAQNRARRRGAAPARA